jgi:HAD superfamily hydrolase (TIGR01484 family)
MKPLHALTTEEARGLVGLFFDLDDTVLTHGRLERDAYGALWDLHGAGLKLVAVTGRPSGWGEVLVRQWPIDAAITESGPIVLVREGAVVRALDGASPEERRRRRIRLAAIIEAAAVAVPEVRLTDDMGGRRADVTWDIGETVRVPEDRIAILQRVIVEHGAWTTRSSVHVHATFDGEDKASGAVRFASTAFGEDAGAARFRWAFAGDSANDRSCFSAFRTTFGVANVKASLSALAVPPRYVSSAERGAGFVQIAAAILAARVRT